MNIEMDARAKQQAQTVYHSPDQYTIPYEVWRCTTLGHQTTKQLQIKLQDHINGITIQQHWANTNCYGKGTAHMINWDTAAQAMQTLLQVLQ